VTNGLDKIDNELVVMCTAIYDNGSRRNKKKSNNPIIRGASLNFYLTENFDSQQTVK